MRQRNNVQLRENVQGICGYNLVYNFFVYFLPLKSSLFVVHFSNAFQHGKEALPKHDSQTTIVPLFVTFHLRQLIQACKCFYTKFEDQIGRAELQKILTYFHYHLNLYIRCKAKLKIKFMFYRMPLFYRMNFSCGVKIFFNRIKFFERRYKYLFKQIICFEKEKIL